MAYIQEAVRDYLLSSPAIVDRVGDRIFPDFIPHDTDAPCIGISVRSHVPHTVQQGDTGIAIARIELHSYAEYLQMAWDITRIARALMSGFAGHWLGLKIMGAMLGNQLQSPARNIELSRVVSDYRVRYCDPVFVGVNPSGNVGAPINADFIADKTMAQIAEIIQFTDLTDGNPTIWAWSFGDSNTSALQNPTHAYSAEGLYTVSLLPENAQGAAAAEIKTNYIEIIDALFYDTFTDSDGVYLSSHTPDIDSVGGGWLGDTTGTPPNYGFYVQNNTCFADNKETAGSPRANIWAYANVSEADCNITCYYDPSLGTGGPDIPEYKGFLMRYTDTSNFWYTRKSQADGGITIFEVNGGTTTARAFAATAYTGAYTIDITLNGSTITSTEGTATATYNSATHNQTATRHGLFVNNQNAYNPGQAYYDNFRIDSL